MSSRNKERGRNDFDIASLRAPIDVSICVSRRTTQEAPLNYASACPAERGCGIGGGRPFGAQEVALYRADTLIQNEGVEGRVGLYRGA